MQGRLHLTWVASVDVYVREHGVGSLVRILLECAMSLHWTMHPAFAVVDKDVEPGECCNWNKNWVLVWSPVPMILLSILAQQSISSKWVPCGSAAHIIINTKGPLSLLLLLPFLCLTTCWLLFLPSLVSSHYTDPGKRVLRALLLPHWSLQTSSCLQPLGSVVHALNLSATPVASISIRV